MTYWRRWLWRPQTLWLRRAIFQVHLWSGIGAGLYVLMISVTGSILVYKNELYVAATPDPITVKVTGAQLTDEQLRGAASRKYPGYTVVMIGRAGKADQAVRITLQGKVDLKNRLFDPYTGADLGDAVPPAIRLISKLTELHDDLLGGKTGRMANQAGAVLVILLALSGMVVWWPGLKTWRRNLFVRRGAGWPRWVWGLHGMIGIWSLGFILVFGVSGIYLANPQPFQDLADRIQPPTGLNAGTRAVDQILYWLAFLHFGRVNGIGIPCNGPGWCDAATKLTWAAFGLAPSALFLTGVVMWWNRRFRRR